MGTPDAPSKPPSGSLRVLWCCGWSTRFSQQWMAESAAKLYQKLGSARVEHVVSIEGA
jgi:hypothetical protein